MGVRLVRFALVIRDQVAAVIILDVSPGTRPIIQVLDVVAHDDRGTFLATVILASLSVCSLVVRRSPTQLDAGMAVRSRPQGGGRFGLQSGFAVVPDRPSVGVVIIWEPSCRKRKDPVMALLSGRQDFIQCLAAESGWLWVRAAGSGCVRSHCRCPSAWQKRRAVVATKSAPGASSRSRLDPRGRYWSIQSGNAEAGTAGIESLALAPRFGGYLRFVPAQGQPRASLHCHLQRSTVLPVFGTQSRAPAKTGRVITSRQAI